MFSNIEVIAEKVVNEPISQVKQWIAENNGSAKASDAKFKPLVCCGPSGAGKGTLINALTSENKDKFGFSVSYTTRAPRDGEKHGIHYFFVSHEEFQKIIDEDGFIEWCQVHANRYGTAKSQIMSIQAAKKIPLLDIDV